MIKEREERGVWNVEKDYGEGGNAREEGLREKTS